MSLGLEPDVIINVHKGQDGYGIFFAQREEGMVVTKLDPNSEAMKAGVQPGDWLVKVQDNESKLPLDAPGVEVTVTKENYSVRLPADYPCPARLHSLSGLLLGLQVTLNMVRGMRYAKLSFCSSAMASAFGD